MLMSSCLTEEDDGGSACFRDPPLRPPSSAFRTCMEVRIGIPHEYLPRGNEWRLNGGQAFFYARGGGSPAETHHKEVGGPREGGGSLGPQKKGSKTQNVGIQRGGGTPQGEGRGGLNGPPPHRDYQS